jgi:cellobiose dehydrogenase (acceptor)
MQKIITLVLLVCALVLAQEYDIIVVGAGTASSIVATRLVQEFPNKQILILEAGAPTSKRVGGNDYPPYAQSSQDVCYVDVPGEYGSMAWTALGDRYKLKEAAFTWQGMGYGGNSQFNGMLFQSAPVSNMDLWPSGWKSSDLVSYYERVIGKTNVTPAPSANGANYNTAIAQALRGAFNQCGLTEQDTRILNSNLGAVPKGYFSRPYVVTDGNGKRGGIIDAYLSQIINAQGTSSKSNLKIIPLAKVSKILFDASGTATGVQYYLRSNKQDVGSSAPQGELRSVNLKSGGRVILGAGALITPRLLYMSGVGPVGQESQRGSNLHFTINNPAVGTVLTDHVGIQIGVKYTGATNYNYANYNGNAADINQYMSSKSGPYSQFGPVLFAHIKSSAAVAHPNIEIMVNPGSNGGSNPTYSASNVFQIMLIHLNQRATTKLSLNADGFVNWPNVYSNSADVDEMADALFYFLNEVLPKTGLQVVFGPGGSSHPNLNKANWNDVRSFITGGSSMDGISYSGMIMNHFTGTVPLLEGDNSVGGVDPNTLVVRGTKNVHVVDASLYLPPVAAHPVATIMAGAEKCADLLVDLMQVVGAPAITSSAVPVPTTTTHAPTTTAPVRNCWTCYPGYMHWYDNGSGYSSAPGGDQCACVKIPSSPSTAGPATTSTTRAPTTTTTAAPTTTAPVRNCWTCYPGYQHCRFLFLKILTIIRV